MFMQSIKEKPEIDHSSVKQQLGQFFTYKSDYILQNLQKYVVGKDIVDPFVGSGELLNWAMNNGARSVKGFDVDKRFVDGKTRFQNDSLLNRQKYDFVLTNPPYLNINKASGTIKEKYFNALLPRLEDLYHLSLFSIMDSEEGIVIVPVNFLSAKNSEKIREAFFSKFKIVEMNYFKEQVFSDTTYNVIAFYYIKHQESFQSRLKIAMHVYPDEKSTEVLLERAYGWGIGGRITQKMDEIGNALGVHRLTEAHMKNGQGKKEIRAAYNHIDNRLKVKVSEELYALIKSNILLLKAIDTGSLQGRISLEDITQYGADCLISKESSRHMIHLLFSTSVPLSEQRELVRIFNEYLGDLRNKQLSLFLTNYRDKNRKRISFDFAYKLINYLYFNIVTKKLPKTLFDGV